MAPSRAVIQTVVLAALLLGASAVEVGTPRCHDGASFECSPDESSLLQPRVDRNRGASGTLGKIAGSTQKNDEELAHLKFDGLQYTVMVDCGSSGTRALVYSRHLGGVNLTEIHSKEKLKIGPMSAFGDNPQDAGPAMLALVNKTLCMVPEDMWSQTHVYAYATAGMRSMAVMNGALIWESVRKSLADTPYLFESQQAKTMSGTLEGVYQLMTVNQIEMQYKDGGNLLGDTLKDVVGIMEMGGASMQAAFRPETPPLVNEFDITCGQGKLLNQFPVYSNSWLGFGNARALQRSCETLLQRNVTTNPCLLKGPTYPITLNPSTKNEMTVNFTGGSDAPECSKLVHSLLHEDYECLQEPCAIMGSYFPRPVGKFLGIAAFFWTLNGLGLIDMGDAKEVPVTDIQNQAELLCGLTAEQAMATPPFNSTKWNYGQWNCFNGYLVAEVVRAFKLTEPGSKLVYQADLYGQDLSWTRGAVLYETSNPMGQVSMM